jgi:hypothetical protein
MYTSIADWPIECTRTRRTSSCCLVGGEDKVRRFVAESVRVVPHTEDHTVQHSATRREDLLAHLDVLACVVTAPRDESDHAICFVDGPVLVACRSLK